MEYDVSKMPVFVQRIIRNQDSWLGNLVIWFLGLTIFPIGGFYLWTIGSAYSNKTFSEGAAPVTIRHYYDLRVDDIHVGGYGALIGLALGICFGLWATFWYPRLKEIDAAEDAETQERIHHLLSHRDEIATDQGQHAEHVLDHPTSEE